jgi:beta-xylosidase
MTPIIQTNITNIGDPFILVHDGIYYHYSTSANDGFKVYTSTNLVDWKMQGYCYRDSKVGIGDFWAPEVYYYKDSFYMFFTSKNKYQDRLMLSVAIAKDPLGPFVDVSDSPTFDFGYAAIDAHVFFDTDGRIYMYYSKDCSENIVNGVHTSQIYAVELTDDLLYTKGTPVMVLTPEGPHEERLPDWQWNEGPFMLKDDDTYYLSYSSNFFQSKDYSVSYATSNHPLGPFHKAEENPILSYIPDTISGPGHNAYFKTFDDVPMTTFHIHTNPENPSGNRRTCFSRYSITNNKLRIEYK